MSYSQIIKSLFLYILILLSSVSVASADSIHLGGKNVYVSSGTSYYLQSGGGLTNQGASANNYNVKFDKASDTLTLKNVNITTGAGDSTLNPDPDTGVSPVVLYIDVNGPLTIELEGSNTLGEHPVNTTYGISTAIYAHTYVKPLTIKDGPGDGIGSLTLKAQDYGIYYRGEYYSSSTNDNLVFESGSMTIDANAGGSGMQVTGIYLCYAKKFIMNGGTVNITAYTNDSVNHYATGISCNAFEMHGGDLEVYAKSRGSRVTAIKTSENIDKRMVYTGGSMKIHAEDSGSSDLSNYNDAFNSFFKNIQYNNDNSENTLKQTEIWVHESDGTGASKYKWNNNTNDFQKFCPYAYVEIKDTRYTVTYTDGVNDEVVFEDQVNSGLGKGSYTPAFSGTPSRSGYTFIGWDPAVADTVTGNATYVAQWETLPTYTVTYTDGVNDEVVFDDQTTNGLYSGDPTPVFSGTPSRSGYTFIGWDPAVADTVTGNVTYVAQWKKDDAPTPADPPAGNEPTDKAIASLPKTGDQSSLFFWSTLLSFVLCGLAVFHFRKEKN